MILIDLAAYAHDTNAQMEEVLTMNSFYHPREHDQEDHVHSAQHRGADYAQGHAGHAGHEEHEGHTGRAEHTQDAGYQATGTAQEPDAAPTPQSSEYSGNDLDMYQVLLAVERGELSPEDAARKLEELETSGQQESGSGVI